MNKLTDDNQTLHQNLQSVEFQRNSLQTNYSQLVHIQEQLQRDLYAHQQKIQQLQIDYQYQEQCHQKAMENFEQQRNYSIRLESSKPDQSRVRLQTQVLDLEQENYNLRLELVEAREQSMSLKNDLESTKLEIMDFASERLILKQEQEKLIRLTDELLLEATQLNKNEEIKDPQFQMLNEWRNFIIQKYNDHDYAVKEQENQQILGDNDSSSNDQPQSKIQEIQQVDQISSRQQCILEIYILLQKQRNQNDISKTKQIDDVNCGPSQFQDELQLRQRDGCLEYQENKITD